MTIVVHGVDAQLPVKTRFSGSSTLQAKTPPLSPRFAANEDDDGRQRRRCAAMLAAIAGVFLSLGANLVNRHQVDRSPEAITYHRLESAYRDYSRATSQYQQNPFLGEKPADFARTQFRTLLQKKYSDLIRYAPGSNTAEFLKNAPQLKEDDIQAILAQLEKLEKTPRLDNTRDVYNAMLDVYAQRHPQINTEALQAARKEGNQFLETIFTKAEAFHNREKVTGILIVVFILSLPLMPIVIQGRRPFR